MIGLGGEMSKAATRERLATILGQIDHDKELADDWIRALKRIEYSFGVGMLRDENDCYDPFGLLAEINDADWVFDEAEGAWAIDGSAFFLKPERLSEWLGMDIRKTTAIKVFIDTVSTLSDGARTLAEIAEHLESAFTTARSRRERLKQEMSAARDERIGPVWGDIDPRQRFNEVHLMPRFGRRGF